MNAGLNDSPDDYNLFEETIASHCSPSPVKTTKDLLVTRV